MGSGASIGSVLSEIPKEWFNIFKAMKLQNVEIKKLFDLYNTVDADRSGSIDVVELLMFLDIERTLFTERIFEAFDKDHTHRIDFYEFTVSVWKFCTLGKEATPVFAFDLYDTNADGRLSTKDVHVMFRELLGSKAMDQEPTQRAIAELLKEEINGHIGVETFRRFIRLHQKLLLPVFGIQNKLRISTLGIKTFEKISKRSIEIRTGCTVALSDLMVLHSHRKMFFAIMSDETMQRVSSMMRIVLENTDNALHKTPSASPRISPLERTKILSPFPTATSTGTGTSTGGAAAVSGGGASASGYASPARSPSPSPALSPPCSARSTHSGTGEQQHHHHTDKHHDKHQEKHHDKPSTHDKHQHVVKAAHGHGHELPPRPHTSTQHSSHSRAQSPDPRHGHSSAPSSQHSSPIQQQHKHMHLVLAPPVTQQTAPQQPKNAAAAAKEAWAKRAKFVPYDDPLLHQSAVKADNHPLPDVPRRPSL